MISTRCSGKGLCRLTARCTRLSSRKRRSDGTTPTVKVCGLQFDVQTIEDRKILWAIVRKITPEPPAPTEEETKRSRRKRDRDNHGEAEESGEE